MATFGAKLKAAREGRGWSQEELGEAIGARQKQVSSWERGRVVPKLPFALAIADRLGLSLNYLMDNSVAVDEKAMYTDPERLLVAYCRARKLDPEAALAILTETECRTGADKPQKPITVIEEILDQPPPRAKSRPRGHRSNNSA